MSGSLDSLTNLKNKRGRLQIELVGCVGLPVSEKADISCLVSVEGHDGVDEGRTPVIKNGGPNAQFHATYPFEYDGAYIATFNLFDGGKEVASGEVMLLDIIKDGNWEGLVDLEPSGKLKISVRFAEKPNVLPDFLRVCILSFSEAPEKEGFMKHKEAYVKVQVKEGRTEQTRQASATKGMCPFGDEFDYDYHGEPDVGFTLMDHDKMSHDDELGHCSYDLWRVVRDGNMIVTGNLKVIDKNHDFIGHLNIGIQFWNKGQSPAISPRPSVEPLAPKKSISSVSSSVKAAPLTKAESGSSFDSAAARPLIEAALLDAKDAQDAARRARRAAEKARESARDSGSPEARLDADEADRAADEAERAALKAHDLAEEMQKQRSSPELARMADLARDNCVAANKHANDAELLAKEAARHAADEEARKARAAAREAKDASKECERLGESFPHIEGLGPLVEEARQAQRRAQEEAKRAGRAAEACDEPGLPLDSLRDLEENARKARKKAEKADFDAQEALRNAKRLLRDRARIESKKDKLRQERELERLRQLEEEKNRTREREHEKELQRRREMGDLEATERAMYNGAQAYSYHNAYKNMSPQNGRAACCWRERKGSSFSSLEGTNNIPRNELRGVVGHDTLYVNEDEMVIRARGSDPDILGRRDFVTEIRVEDAHEVYRRNNMCCWCFGCGCCRCLGEC